MLSSSVTSSCWSSSILGLMRLLPKGRYNLIIDLFSDLSRLDLIPALPVAVPCNALHDAVLLLSLQGVRFPLQVQAQSLDKYLRTQVLELNLSGLESPALPLMRVWANHFTESVSSSVKWI